MDDECLFCNLYDEGKDFIYETRFFYSIFDQFPISPGHALVISKRHAISIFDLIQDEWIDLFSAIRCTKKRVESSNLQKAYLGLMTKSIDKRSIEIYNKMLASPNLNKRPGGYNLANNEGEAAGRTINHFHYHIIPRYLGDTPDPIGGIRNIIPGQGNYKK
jgi:diadenosine tetraphosphate (Ap4A) HIT family hydrolase